MKNPRCSECNRLIKTEQHEVWCKFLPRAAKLESLGRPQQQEQASTPFAWHPPWYDMSAEPMPIMVAVVYAAPRRKMKGA